MLTDGPDVVRRRASAPPLPPPHWQPCGVAYAAGRQVMSRLERLFARKGEPGNRQRVLVVSEGERRLRESRRTIEDFGVAGSEPAAPKAHRAGARRARVAGLNGSLVPLSAHEALVEIEAGPGSHFASEGVPGEPGPALCGGRRPCIVCHWETTGKRSCPRAPTCAHTCMRHGEERPVQRATLRCSCRPRMPH